MYKKILKEHACFKVFVKTCMNILINVLFPCSLCFVFPFCFWVPLLNVDLSGFMWAMPSCDQITAVDIENNWKCLNTVNSCWTCILFNRGLHYYI